MDFYTINTNNYIDESKLPVATDPETNTTEIGSGTTSYLLPNNIGTNGQVMVVPASGNQLIWGAGGGGGVCTRVGRRVVGRGRGCGF